LPGDDRFARPSPGYNLAALRARALVAALAALLLLGLPAHALAGAFTPESGGSQNADEIATLYKIVLAIAVVILLIVEGTLGWCLVKYRARKGRTAAQIHGNTNLEIGWTVGAALILVVLAAVTFLTLDKITNPPNSNATGVTSARPVLAASTTPPRPPNGKALQVCVTGRQYIWRYTYSTCANAGLGKPYAYQELVVPARTVVVLDIQSTDVVHSWWIPKLGGKFDAVPGKDNYTWFKASTPGAVYTGQCAELCGRNHADMTARVRVLSPTEFESWLARQKQLIAQANRAAEQQRKTLEKTGDL
jgi:cytochrome c oxidase subunit II